MTLGEVQFYVEMMRRFFEANPELCPHDFHWFMTEVDGTKRFQCSVCGKVVKTKEERP